MADKESLRTLAILAILAIERLQLELSVAFVPVLLSGKVGRDDGQGRKDGRVFVCSLEIKVDNLAPKVHPSARPPSIQRLYTREGKAHFSSYEGFPTNSFPSATSA